MQVNRVRSITATEFTNGDSRRFRRVVFQMRCHFPDLLQPKIVPTLDGTIFGFIPSPRYAHKLRYFDRN